MVTSRSLRVAVAGAGLAGLTLAHRLVAAGADVTVYERDPEPFARAQGYRITVDRHGIDALRRSLPAELFEVVMRTSGPPGGHFRFTNEHLRDAFVLSFAAEPDAERQVDRDVLRRTLLGGLGERVVFGAPVRAVRTGPDGPVVEFADATRRAADIVVIADGIGSDLGGMVFPGAGPADTGRGGIYGRAPLYAGGRCVLPDSLLDSGFLAMLPTSGSAFFFTAMRFGEDPAAVFASALPYTQAPPARESYIMWGLVLPPGDRAAAQTDSSSAALLRRCGDAVRAAHPLVRALVERTDPSSVLLSRFRAGTRPGAAALPRTAVLGDAVHPMPPFGAHGGNTALRDAAELGDRLVGVLDTATDADTRADARHAAVEAAVRGYHEAMATYAFEAVDSAVAQMNRLSTANPLQRWVLRRVLPGLHRRTVPTRTGGDAVGHGRAAR